MVGTDLEKSTTDVHVLVVEDHRDVADFLREVIESLGCTVETIHNGVDVRAAIEQRPPDVMFLDLGLPGMDGIEVLRELGTLNCKSKIFMMSGSDLRTLAAAEELGKQRALSIAGTIPKPIMAEDVEAVLKPLLKSNYPLESLDVREALARGDFFILFQPKVNLRSESQIAVQGAEALLRWNHPTFGIIPPDRFLDAIRQQALMPEVTSFVMKEAVSACKYWKDQGHELTVGINIDGSQMGDLQLPDFLGDLTRQYDIPNHLINLEITESAAMADPIASIDILTRFRVKNFNVAMDDFGTGYSSLVQLYRMPFNELKIDKSFVLDIEKKKEARTIVETVIMLGKKLGVVVCAEGIETDKTCQFLRDRGCDLGQGYLFSKPIEKEVMLINVRAPDAAPSQEPGKIVLPAQR